jgi:hypothetical protein
MLKFNKLFVLAWLIHNVHLIAVPNLSYIDDPFFSGPEANQWEDAKGPIFKNHFTEPADNLSYGGLYRHS